MKSIPPDRPTLKSVAAAAGVSVATASRVMAGKSASSRSVAAVQAASRRLGYRPDPIARAMRGRTTGTVGLVLPELRNPFFADLTATLENNAYSEGLEVLVADSHGTAEHEQRRLETLLDRRVDGILIAPADERLSAEALRRASAQVPVVQIDRFVRDLDVDYVGVDNHRGISELLKHLHSLGCQSLAFASEKPSNSTARARRDAFETESQEFGLSVVRRDFGRFSIEYGRHLASDLVRSGGLPDAIVCGSDVIAVGLVTGLADAGVKVPDEVLVTGFDDILLAGLVPPGITTVRQPLTAIANEAVARLLGRLANTDGPSRQSAVRPTLVTRRSTLREVP